MLEKIKKRQKFKFTNDKNCREEQPKLTFVALNRPINLNFEDEEKVER